MFANKLEIENYSLKGHIFQLEKKNVEHFIKILLC